MEVVPVIRGDMGRICKDLFELLRSDACTSGQELPLFFTDGLGIFLDGCTDQESIQFFMGLKQRARDAGEHDLRNAFVQATNFQLDHCIELGLLETCRVELLDVLEGELVHRFYEAESSNDEVKNGASDCSGQVQATSHVNFFLNYRVLLQRFFNFLRFDFRLL